MPELKVGASPEEIAAFWGEHSKREPSCAESTMQGFKNHALKCHNCALAQSRTQVVWGTGSANAALVFVGEAPGRNEDLGGEPFIGAAGKVLDEFLAEAGLNRDEVYIANVVKCRPPNNRNPLPEEIAACSPYLQIQLELIRPTVVVTLGKFASQSLLQTTRGISSLQGQLQQTEHFKVLPLYHPAATIYDRTKREPFFEAATTLRQVLSSSDAS
ncbi:MAG: uracil-DNA glycosylase [Coriobacteriia bacterium]|nr:uracil-DNA glycosylase [Coriobacteriia bacterium]MCL2870442.1 uracil-DNA glycosylase [Coriobacteriia bacterium]